MALSKPSGEETEKLVSTLLGSRAMAAHSGPAYDSAPYVAGWFVSKEGERQAVCILEFQLLAHMAGKMAMFPDDRVEEVVHSGEMDGTFAETANEVLNVLGQLLNRGTGHVRLGDTEMFSDCGPPDGADLSKGDAANYKLNADGFSGAISFVLLPTT